MGDYEKPKAIIGEFPSGVAVRKDSFRSRVKHLLHGKFPRRRNRSPQNQVVLEKVHGVTASSDGGLACDPSTGVVAYAAGCVVVILRPKEGTQSHILNSSRKAFTALAFSQGGRYLVTGEHGHKPCVRVWDVSKGVELAGVQCHQYGVSCVAFHSSGDYVVSVGCQQDMAVSVWEWRKGAVIASNKVSNKVLTMSFSEDRSYFVTAGNRMIKFWYLDVSRNRQANSTVPLTGRPALLGEQWNGTFCGLACGRGQTASSTYSVTTQGLLCRVNGRRLLEAWVDLKTASAHCLSVSEDYVFCGCADATVRVFNPSDLSYVTTLPRPQKHCVAITQSTEAGNSARYPDTLALTFDPLARYLTCVYSNHSVYVWDICDIRNAEVVYSALYHSNGVWSVEMYPDKAERAEPHLPAGSFLTCSSDGTIRLWPGEPSAYCSGNNGWNQHPRQIVCLKNDTEQQGILGEPKEARSSHMKLGISVMTVSPDGLHLAAGDWGGSLRVFCLQLLRDLLLIKAHDSEVLHLAFSSALTGLNLLASAGRDGCIHIFNRETGYSREQTVCDHSAPIIGIKFTGSFPHEGLVSCAGDGNIYLYTTQKGEFSCSSRIATKTTVTDLSLDAISSHTIVACQDHIRVYSLKSGKIKKCIKSPQSDVAFLKVQADVSGMFLATSCSDSTIRLFDYSSGDCVATLFGHSDSVTGMRFSHDCRHLISASGDSCVFVWRLASEMTKAMKNLADYRRRSCSSTKAAVSQLFASPRKQTCDACGPLTPDGVIGRQNQEEHGSCICTYSGHEEGNSIDGSPTPLLEQSPWAPSSVASPVQEQRQVSCQPRARWAEHSDPQAVLLALETQSFRTPLTPSPGGNDVANEGNPLRLPKHRLYDEEMEGYPCLACPDKQAGSKHSLPGTDLLLLPCDLETWSLQSPAPEMSDHSFHPTNGSSLQSEEGELGSRSLRDVPLAHWMESRVDLSLDSACDSGSAENQASDLDWAFVASSSQTSSTGSSKEELRSISQAVPGAFDTSQRGRQWPLRSRIPSSCPGSPTPPVSVTPSWFKDSKRCGKASPHTDSDSISANSTKTKVSENILQQSKLVNPGCKNTGLKERFGSMGQRGSMDHFISPVQRPPLLGCSSDFPTSAHRLFMGIDTSSHPTVLHNSSVCELVKSQVTNPNKLANQSAWSTPNLNAPEEPKECPPISMTRPSPSTTTAPEPSASTDTLLLPRRHTSRAGSRLSGPVCRAPAPLSRLSRSFTATQRAALLLSAEDGDREAQPGGARPECSTKGSLTSHGPMPQSGGTWSCSPNTLTPRASVVLSDSSSALLKRERTVEVKSKLHSYSQTSSPGDAVPSLALPKESTISDSDVMNVPIGLNTCKRIVSDLEHSVMAAVGLYRKLYLSHGCLEQCSQMRLLLDDVFSEVKSDLSCAFNSALTREQGSMTDPRNTESVTLQLQSDRTVALLERYSEILVQITARKANPV